MICITGNTSELKCTLFPSIDLSEFPNWEMGFYDFATYNAIPNVEENVNNKIYFDSGISVSLPTGSYELEDISKFINNDLKRQNTHIKFHLSANVNTLKCEIYCNHDVDFTKSNSIASILGFEEGITLKADTWHESSKPVDIIKVNVIRITCNVVRGSYRDGVEGHVLHEFYPNVGPGFKIVEKPRTVKYLPINKQTTLSEFYIRIEDQNGKLVNFREETINLRVDIRPEKTTSLLETIVKASKKSN